MGIYSINLGKGIIVPVKVFVKKHLEKVLKIYKEEEGDLEETISLIVTEVYGNEYQVTSIGHDAFKSRDGKMDVLGGDNKIAFDIINKLREQVEDDLPIKIITFSDLIFIGYFRVIESTGGDLEYYVKTPELLYGLPSLLPSIIEAYGEMSNKDCSVLKGEFEQNPCIWTFAIDCNCCG